MLLPSTSSPSFVIVIFASKAAAAWTNFAAARAWRPRRFLSVSDLFLHGCALRRRRPRARRPRRSRGGPRSTSVWAISRGLRPSRASARAFTTIGKVDARDDLDRARLEEREREVRRRSAEHVREEDDAAPAVRTRRSPSRGGALAASGASSHARERAPRSSGSSGSSMWTVSRRAFASGPCDRRRRPTAGPAGAVMSVERLVPVRDPHGVAQGREVAREALGHVDGAVPSPRAADADREVRAVLAPVVRKAEREEVRRGGGRTAPSARPPR